MKTPFLCGALLLVSTLAGAQTPSWTATLTPTLNPLPLGMCGAVHLTLKDNATNDVPRNPQGYRVTMADFDMRVNSRYHGAVGHHIDATHFEVCACQGAALTEKITVTATYPAQSLPTGTWVRQARVNQSADVVLALPKGTANPGLCVTAGAASQSPPNPAQSSNQTTVLDSPPVGQAAATPRATTPAPSSSPPVTNQPVAVASTSRTPAAVVPAQTPAPAPSTTPATAPVPVNPGGLEFGQIGPGEVGLAWNPVADASFYVVFGPGLTPGGQRVENQVDPRYAGTPFPAKVTVIASNVPAGTQEWLVASYYSPGNVSTPASEYSKATVNVTAPAVATPPAASTPAPAAPPTSGKYLVTATGFRAYQASMDDMLSRDGVGDEIYAAVYVRRYDQRTSQLAEAVMRQSAVQGDIFHFATQRLQAGTKSQTGGIQDGDPVPDGPLLAMRGVPAQDANFPLRLWEGTLTDGIDTLILSPSLWEQDGSDSYYAQWAQYQQTINTSLYTKAGVQNEMAQKTFRPLVFGMSGNSSQAVQQAFSRVYGDLAMVFGGGVPIIGLLSTSADRPLGLVDSGVDRTALPNHAVVLTREIIEAALAKPALGSIQSPLYNSPASAAAGISPLVRLPVLAPKPGILVIHFQDATGVAGVVFPERPAIYQMYIQVERIP